MKLGRNDRCPCGSGKKYKQCHGKLDIHSASRPLSKQALPALPSQQEVGVLMSLFSRQRYMEAEPLARLLTERFPLLGFGWKVLGAVLQQMGRNMDALAAMQRAATLLPGDGEALNNLGIVLHNLNRLGEAEASFRRALQIKPDYAEAHCNLGSLLNDMRRQDEAEASFRRALQIKPDYAEAHCNLGSLLNGVRRQDEAEASFRRALQHRSDLAEAHSNLGNILKDMGRLNEAEASYCRALEIAPHLAEAHNNLGIVLQELARPDEAEASYRKALQIRPDYSDAYANLAHTLSSLGRTNEALACYQRQIELDPEAVSAQHHIAALTGKNTERAPDGYIEKLFDSYADKFDTHLQQALEYEAPAKLAALVERHLMPVAEKWSILDLGCGTGLVGSAMAPFARQLVGVDLSEKMLKKANARNIYQRLERSDLLAMMRSEKASSYDVIVAADVFIYLGRLDEIVGEIKRLLRPDGVFAFSIETLDPPSNEEESQSIEQEYRLKETGRYSQSISYLARLASVNDFLSKEMVAVQIRMEKGKPVKGHLVLWESWAKE